MLTLIELHNSPHPSSEPQALNPTLPAHSIPTYKATPPTFPPHHIAAPKPSLPLTPEPVQMLAVDTTPTSPFRPLPFSMSGSHPNNPVPTPSSPPSAELSVQLHP